MNKQAKTLNELLRYGSIRIINKELEPDFYKEVLEANQWDENPEEEIYEFTAQEDVDKDQQWALDLTGFVGQVSSLEEFVNVVNFELEAQEDEPAADEKDSSEGEE